MDFKCPRCGYSTMHKPSMSYHLFKRKDVCDGDLDLTDNIKQYVLIHRQYNERKHNAQLNKSKRFLGSINSLLTLEDKLLYFCQYKNIDLVDFPSTIRENGKTLMKPWKISRNYMNIVAIMSNAKQISNLNFFADKDRNYGWVYDFQKGLFEKQVMENIVDKVLETTNYEFFHEYEWFLYKQRPLNMNDRDDVQKSLDRLYTYLACLDLEPNIISSDDHRDMKLEEYDKYVRIFNGNKKIIKKRQRQSLRKKTFHIIKRACIDNAKFLKNEFDTLFVKDIMFRHYVLQNMNFKLDKL